MSEKKPTVSSLKQEIEQIKAQLKEQAQNHIFFTNNDFIDLQPGEVLVIPVERPDHPVPPNEYSFGFPPRPVSVNCQCYRAGYCAHQAAPRSWFGKTPCIERDRPADPRLKRGCALKCEYPKHEAPKPPPKRP